MKENRMPFQEAADFTKEDFQAMLLEKQRELNEQIEANNKLVAEKNQMTTRALKVHEENSLMKASPELATQMAEMEIHLRMAKQFTASGAFPNVTPEQAYTLMKAGAEMGMKPVESLNSLYIVNGQINPHGKAMPARIKKAGYNVEYLNETADGCDVRVWSEAEGLDVTEHVDANDPILAKQSRFMKLHPKYKMRYHGLRAVINFPLPHLFSSAADMFAEPVQEILAEQGNGLNVALVEENKERRRIRAHIDAAANLATLQMVANYVDDAGLSEEYAKKYSQLSTEKAASDEEQ